MYNSQSTEGKKVRCSFDRNRYSDFDRLCMVSELSQLISNYKTFLPTRIGPIDTVSMVDTGNTFATCINSKMQDALKIKKSDLQPYQGRTSIGTAKKRARMIIAGETKKEHSIYFSSSLPPIKTKLVILPDMGMPVNISGPTLEKYNMAVLAGKHVTYKGQQFPLVSRRNAGPEIQRHSAAHILPIYTACNVTIAPYEEVHISAIAVDSWDNQNVKCAILSPSSSFEEKFDVASWRSAAITLRRGKRENDGKYLAKIGIINPTTRPIRVPKGTYYGNAELIISTADPRRDEYRICYLSSSEVRRTRQPTADEHETGTGYPPGQLYDLTVGAVTVTDSSRTTSKPKTGFKKSYITPPSADKQHDPPAGNPVKLPGWMKGATTKSNWTQRYKYFEELFEVTTNKNLDTPEKRQLLISLFLLHWELFAWDGSYGKTNVIQHYIKTTPGCEPVNEHYRPINPALRPALRKQLDTWLENNVVEVSDSEWNSNLLACVKSSDINSIRWVVDYRKLNQSTTIDRFPIGDINDNLSRLGKSKYFSCLDNSGAFHCIEIAPEDRHKTSFATPFNTYQFCRLPFGLSGGPSSYARLVVEVLKHIPVEQAVAYVDDVLVHSGTFPQHLGNLDRVFTAYTKAGLKLNPKKCKFMASKIDYLGHSVSQAGIEPQEAYLKVVKEWPVPLTRQDILVFLGKIGYYRKFIMKFAKIAQPLTELLKIAGKKPSSKGVPVTPLSKSQRRRIMEEPIELSKEAVKAFNTLKQALLSHPILGHPYFDDLKKQYYILDTEWCQETNTCSGCLSQYQKDEQGKFQVKAIGYASKKLNKSQANYTSPKGEIYATLLMMDHFKYHLMIGHFILRTNSIAARALQEKTTEPAGYLSRWKARLANYDFTVIPRPGTKDVLDEKTDLQHLFAIDENSTNTSIRDKNWTPLYIKELQDKNLDFQLLKKWVKLGIKPNTQSRAESSSDLKSYINIFEKLYLDSNDILRYKYSHSPPDGLGTRERNLLVLPAAALTDAVRIIHEKQAHVGIKNTIDVSMQYIFGVGLRAIAEYVCKTCLVCQAKGRKPKPQDYSLVVPRQGMPFQTINLDFVGPLTPSRKRGNIYLLTVEDMLSKWVEAFPVKRATANEVANKLTTEIFPRHGYPEFIKSDRGSHFKNHTIQELSDITGIKHIFSPSYRPQSNPVERAHGTLKNMLRALILDLSDGDPADWEKHLPTALFCYRTTKHSATGFSPFEMLFGHHPSTEASLIFGPPPDKSDYTDPQSYAIAHRNRMTQAFLWANKNITATVARRRRLYYSNAKRLFEVGEQVWLLTPVVRPGQRKSFISPYSGPWTVSRRVNEVVYEIQPHPEWDRKGSEVVTVDRIKKYLAPNNEGTTVNETQPPGVTQDLSLPGNEFLETFTTHGKPDAGSHDSEDEEESGAANETGVQLNGHGVPQSPVHSLPPSRAGSPPPTPPLSPPPPPVIAQPHFFAQPDLDEVVVPAQPENPPPVQHVADLPPLQRVAGAIPRTVRPLAKKRNKNWRDISPVRFLPRRQAAGNSKYGRIGRRKETSSSDDDEVADLDDEPPSPEFSFNDCWDNYDLVPRTENSPLSSTDVSLHTSVDADNYVDVSDQSKVLTQRRSIAENNDCRQAVVSHIPRPRHRHTPPYHMNALAPVHEEVRVRAQGTSLPPLAVTGRRTRRHTPPCVPQALPKPPGRSQSAKAAYQRRPQSRAQSVRHDFKRQLLHDADAYADDAKRHIDATNPFEILSDDYLAAKAFSTPYKFDIEDRILRHSLQPHRRTPLRKTATSRADSPRRIELDRLSSADDTHRRNLEIVEKLANLEKSVKK